ncbi:hypothetical protein N480_21160 [Pseudoalteromonas luteoviolacea S2607]|uniref:malonate decarboxylase subunit alpha n=1 Tax=Pseudoalteromonas luteoviolacea TaxID=43657 RepID=UPI0007B045DF|nr:malonate decarboxylase subunit alpha [Pseudoalteromonas luteoviolacea]KZN34537.1 hypothetical protein N480_21160 [Pseudoalteromonas luteoviolacea S2607]
MEIVTANYVASLIESNSTVIPGGFGCCGHPDLYTEALYRRYENESLPRDLTLFFASGAGDKNGKGLDKLSANGLVKKAIGGFWGFCPALAKKAKTGDIEGHNWPMGVISHLFRDIARGAAGHTTHIGLGSYIDPCIEGGGIHKSKDSLVSKVELRGQELLFYPALSIDFALLRGTKADKKGNICMSEEVAYHDALQQAMAAKNSGGKVAVQVKEIVEKLPCRDVQIPAHLVDFVTLNEDAGTHPSSYGELTTQPEIKTISKAKERIVSRALAELPKQKSCVNLGIGIPALLGKHINEINRESSISVESGVFNGEPKYDLSFGAAIDPDAIIGQSDLFAFYDGGGVDIAFLGFAEIDSKGCVNASLLGEKINGVGGFINIAQSAKKLVFCGTLTTGSLNVEINNNQLCILNEGTIKKFVKKAQQITIDLTHPVYCNKEILVITERAVFSFKNNHLELVEKANGFSEQDIQSYIEYPIYSNSSLTTINT